MSGFHVARTVGRLVEGRPTTLATRDEARRYCDAFRQTVRAAGTPVVVCADYRAVTVFPPFAADELQALMTEMNDRVERSGVLVAPEHATTSLQIRRVVKSTAHPQRRRMDDVVELVRWLSEVLDENERVRLRAFLAEGATGKE